jgi:hypothetical protein
VDVLGQATPLPSLRGVPVTPVLARLMQPEFRNAQHVHQVLPGDAGSEVESIFTVTLKQLLAVETTHVLPKSRFGFSSNNAAPVFPVDRGDKKIWGLTAYILRPILHRLFKPVFFPNKQAIH